MSGVPGDIPPVPAPPLPGHVAQVISLERRRNPEPEPPTDPRRLDLAVTIQKLFKNEDLSLTDSDTAAGFRVALGFFSILVDGAHRRGAFEQEPDEIRAYLQAALHDARQAPDLI